MQTVDERPETIHLYVVREEDPRPSFFPIVHSVLALFVLVVVGVVFPYQQPEQEAFIRVPAVFLPLKVFTTSVHIIPTGVKSYPATTAHGVLTITNGSVISQYLPAGLIFTGNPGNIEVITDFPAFVPAGSANGYGVATITAHAMVSGKIGNIPAYAINRVEGSSIYIRNLTSFHGGKDSYSIPLQLPKDRQTAMDSARFILDTETAKLHDVLAYPCKETTQEKKGILGLSWMCQYVTYSVPSYMKVTHVNLVGKNLLVDVVFIPRPRTAFFK